MLIVLFCDFVLFVNMVVYQVCFQLDRLVIFVLDYLLEGGIDEVVVFCFFKIEFLEFKELYVCILMVICGVYFVGC